MMRLKSAAEMVREAKARIENTSVEQFALEKSENNDLLLIDLRESEERQQHGVIPGSVAIPRGVLEFYADPTSSMHHPEMQLDRRTILYCAGGGRSALAADLLQSMGYKNVAHLEGGFAAWQTAGQPVELHDMWK
ncbi:MAG: hypothetical protein KDE51_08295 [Anaerolineales bacterium]|nr:hypothetical protein [Anaerolineales bacterium]